LEGDIDLDSKDGGTVDSPVSLSAELLDAWLGFALPILCLRRLDLRHGLDGLE